MNDIDDVEFRVADVAVAPERPTATPANNNLPAATTRVVGRGEIIDAIHREIKAERLVSIIGAGGIGKTTVALAVAEQSITNYRDGVWLVDFAPLQEPSLVANAIAAATGLVIHSADALTPLCRFLRDREILLVLDNCEHMVEAIAACAARLIDETAGVHVLATSRSPLRLNAERIHRLPGLATPPASDKLTAVSALSFPAVRLFADRAGDRLETFTLVDADAPVVADICRSLDGIALAIELAAMRVDVFDMRSLRKQLDDRFRLLAGRRAGLERHRTLAATLDWSYSLLPADEAALLCAVSVFAGGFRLSGASAVASLSADNAADILAELTSKSLLSVDADGQELSYRPLETTRAYCLEKLMESAEYEAVRLRHAEYICVVLEKAAGEWGHQPAHEWGAANRRYLDDLRSALGWAISDTVHRSLLIRLTAAGSVLWNHFSLADESRIHLIRAISQLSEADAAGTAVEMRLQLALAAAVLWTRGVVPEARSAMRRAHDLAVQLGDTDFRLRCLRSIGTYELFSGEHKAGIGTLETFLSLVGDEDRSAREDGETHLGCAELFVGRLQSALVRMGGLFQHYPRDFKDKRFARFLYSSSGAMLVVLSHAQWLTGFPDAGIQTAIMMVEYGRETGHELSLSNALAWACILYFWARRDEDCSRHVAMLDEVVERHGIVTWRPIVTFHRAALGSLQRNPPPGAIDDLEKAIGIFITTGHKARLPYYIGVYADALLAHGRLPDAERVIGEALDCAATQGEGWCVPELLRIKAAIAVARNKLDEAETLLVKADLVAQDVGALSFRLRNANDLAKLLRGQSRTAEARRMLQPVYDAFTEGFDTPDLRFAKAFLTTGR